LEVPVAVFGGTMSVQAIEDAFGHGRGLVRGAGFNGVRNFCVGRNGEWSSLAVMVEPALREKTRCGSIVHGARDPAVRIS
jgi:hypothetical protein